MIYPGQIIKRGSNNTNAVLAIKAKLNALGYKSLDASNSNFGSETEAVVKQFQKWYNLKPDGEVGELTWKRLFAGGVIASVNASTSVLAARALAIARTQLNVRELTGKNDGEAVESYLRSVNLGKGYAWCVAFPYWCFRKASQELQIENPLPQTGGVLDHLNKTKGKIISPEEAISGDLVCMDFGGGRGHMYMVTETFQTAFKEMRAFTIEGNTNIEGSREGDGVYERNRLLKAAKAAIRY